MRPTAAFGALWFLIATAVAPSLHLANHDGDHTHGPPGPTSATRPVAHGHDHPHPHEGAHAHQAPDDGDRAPAGAPIDEDHGRGTLSHLGAFYAADAVVPAPESPSLTRPIAPQAAPRSRARIPETIAARGPPSIPLV